MRLRGLGLLVLTVGLAGAQAAPADAALLAGAASADITPPVGTPMFAYTARSLIADPDPAAAMQVIADPDTNLYAKTFEASQGIHTRVLARAIVLERDGKRYALVQADLGGLPYTLTQAVVEQIRTTGISADRLLLSATHTHSSTGPIWPLDTNGYALLGGDLFDPRIFQLTVDGIADAILNASLNLVPARLGVGTTVVTDASRNREFEMYQRDPEAPADTAAAREASIDTGLTVIRVDDSNGRPIGVWSNFAIHPTSFGDGNLLFSGDNAAVAERISEQTISAEAGAAGNPPLRPPVDVWTNGNEGDISPNGDPATIGGEAVQWRTSDFAGAHLAGARVAAGIVRAWRDAGAHMADDLPIAATRRLLLFDGTKADGSPVGPIPVLGLGVSQEGFCAPIEDLAGPGQGKKMPLAGGPGLVPSIVPVSVWRIGPLAIAAMPGEVTKTMGARIRAFALARANGVVSRMVIAGLTNAYVSYTATPEEYDGCTYEGSFTLFGRQMGARYRDYAAALAGSLFAGGAAPPSAPEPPAYLSFGTTLFVPQLPTPSAGTATAQPAATVTRGGHASFSWNGGNPAFDAPRGATFVALQRREGAGWRTVRTDDSYANTTRRAASNVWTQVEQFTECDPLGSYRIHVTGRAIKSLINTGNVIDTGSPYTVDSSPFELRAVTLQADAVVVSGTTASVRARYPNPGPEALLALPRLVLTGQALLRVTAPGQPAADVVAAPDAATGTFAATVAAGSAATLVRVTDACGNATA